MLKQPIIQSIYQVVLLVLILLAVSVRGGATFEWLSPPDEEAYTLADIQRVYPDAGSVKESPNHVISVFNEEEALITMAIFSEDFNASFRGHGGTLPLLIYFNAEYQVLGVQLLENDESPDYIEHIIEKGLLTTWNNQFLDSTVVLKQVDAISGATVSSKAIIKTVNKTLATYLSVQEQEFKPSTHQIAKAVLTVLLLLLSISLALKPSWRKYYWYYLVVVVVCFGFWFKQMLSLETLNSWLVSGISWQGNWQLLLVLVLAIVMACLGHKSYYCTYLCPMGALQRLVNRWSPLKKRSIRLKLSVVDLRSLYFTFIWVSLILGLNLPLGSMEPFKFFSFQVVSNAMLIAGALILVLSLFFNRPWCQVCPTGCLLRTVPTLNSKK